MGHDGPDFLVGGVFPCTEDRFGAVARGVASTLARPAPGKRDTAT